MAGKVDVDFRSVQTELEQLLTKHETVFCPELES